MTKPETPRTRTRSPHHAAASLCVELAALDTADAKAKAATEERAKKRKLLLEGAGADVVQLANAMRAATAVKP